jgi:hypothetical protein
MTEEQKVKEALDIANKLHEGRFKDAPPDMDFMEFENYMDVTGKIVNELSRNYRLIKTPLMSPHDEIGNLFTFEEFKGCVDSGGFIDYDGFGYYSTDTEQSNITIYPSDFAKGQVRTDFTHVKWYNR